MGTAFAERLLDHGFPLRVWNRTRDKADRLIQRGAVWSDNPLAASERIIISLYTTDAVEQVIEQLKGGLRPGQILIDTTTGEPAQTAALARRLAERGVRYLDAPISGSSVQTRRGEATLIVGGDRATFDACRDLWSVLAQNVFYAGACGSAAKMKLVTNLVLGLNRAALAEGLVFAQRIGLDSAATLEVLIASAAYSRAMDVKGRKMIKGDFTVQARLAQHLKDVRLILDQAKAAELALPLSQTHCLLLEEAVHAGLGDLDNSAIIEVLRKGASSS